MRRQTIYAGHLERVEPPAAGDSWSTLATVSDQLTTRDEHTLREVFGRAALYTSEVSEPGMAGRIRALAKRLGVDLEKWGHITFESRGLDKP